ncbi:MAG: B12-binding domain-containing radical SAM protein [bacterium]
MKVLLHNPPGKNLYIRDYFCSKVSQADNLPHPIDLVMLSGILNHEHEISMLDAIAKPETPEHVLEKVRSIAPDVIVMLVGSVSLREDLEWLVRLKAEFPAIKVIGIGDVFRENGDRYLRENPALDAVLLDFTTDDLVWYLRGDLAQVPNMIVRLPDGGIAGGTPAMVKGSFEVPVPRHDLFLPYHYRHSLIRGSRFATTLTDYGCPYPCTFCLMHELGYKWRPAENVMEELRYLKQLGVSEVFFYSQTFGAQKAAAHELCEAMIREQLGFGWVCFSRVDVATPEFLDLMKKAGCHGIIFGIESGSNEILRRYRKQYTVEQILETTDHCRCIGIETTGTFILGLPHEDETTMRDTIRLLKRVKLDYAGINVAVPRVGTALRDEAIAENLVGEDHKIMDQSGTTISMPTKHLTIEQVAQYRRQAIRTFYFRPGYVVRRLMKTRPVDLLKTFRNMLRLIQTTWGGKRQAMGPV